MQENIPVPKKQSNNNDVTQPKPEQKNAKEKLYDKIPVTVHTLDIIIKLLIAAIVVTVILGMVAGRTA